MTTDRPTSLGDVPISAIHPIGGGDICAAFRATLADGRTVFLKTRDDAPDSFFDLEADGLARLGSTRGGVRTPTVIDCCRTHLALEWVTPGPPAQEAAERFGRALAMTHKSGAPVFGSQAARGWIGTLDLPTGPWDSWPQMWAEGRILPFVQAAAGAGAIQAADAYDVEKLASMVAAVAGPPEPPALIHGDLWAGNVIWAIDGSTRVIDPAAHGGHRETDLAMLDLFGFPYLDRVIAAYHELFPLADGWRDRVALHQLHPVLVHAVLFGGSYGSQAGRIARSYR